MKIINTNKAPAAVGPYSHAVEHNGMLFVSGQIPFDPKTNACVPGGIVEQTTQSLENLKAIAEQAGTTLQKAIKVGVFLKDMNDFAAMNEVYSKYFGDHKPARAAVEVARLPKDVMVEIEAVIAV